MATEATEQQRREIYEIAEAIAPTFARRRAYVDVVSTPVREWMLRELAPRVGDRVLELAAGVGETGFDAVAIVGLDRPAVCLGEPAQRQSERPGGVGDDAQILLHVGDLEAHRHILGPHAGEPGFLEQRRVALCAAAD
jgi:hypothetical protein